MTTRSFVRVLRWAVVVGTAVTAAALVWFTHASQSGYYHRPSQYLLIHAIQLGYVIVPALIALDLLLNVVRSATALRAGDVRGSVRTISIAIAIDVLLLAYAFGVLMLVFSWAG